MNNEEKFNWVITSIGAILCILAIIFYTLFYTIIRAKFLLSPIPFMFILGSIIILIGVLKLFWLKNKNKEFNKKLSLIGLIIFIISIFINWFSNSLETPDYVRLQAYLSLPIFLTMIVGLFLLIYGGINNTSFKTWSKWVISIILTILVLVGVFFLMWGLNTAFKFTF